MKTHRFIGVLLASFIIHGLAHAGFEVVGVANDEPESTKTNKAAVKLSAITQPTRVNTEVVTQAVLLGGLMHTGRKPAIIQPANGFAKSVSLKEALGMLVPNNIQVFNDGQVNLTTQVSWSAKDADGWVGVLDHMLREYGISATMDWTENTITLNQQRKTVAKKPEIIWKLLPGDRMVRNSLNRWAKQAGYTLDWDVPVDFPVPYEVSFQGDFEGAVAEVMASLKGTDYPVQSCSYENNAIRIVRYGDTDRCKLNH